MNWIRFIITYFSVSSSQLLSYTLAKIREKRCVGLKEDGNGIIVFGMLGFNCFHGYEGRELKLEYARMNLCSRWHRPRSFGVEV